MANFGSAFGNAFQGATHATDVLSQLAQQKQQQDAMSKLAMIIQQYSGGQQPQTSPSGILTPQGPAPTPQPGGAPSPTTDLQRLVGAIMAQKDMSGGAQGYALQDAMKMLQPQSALSTRQAIAGEQIQGRKDVAGMNNEARVGLAKYKSQLNDKTNTELTREIASLGNALRSAAPGTPEYIDFKDRLDAADNILQQRRADAGLKKKDAGAATTKPIADAGGGAAAPAADMVPVTAPDGTLGFVPADQLEAAISAGYKKR